MNVNSISNSPNFAGIYVNTDGMNRGSKEAAYHLMNSIEYSDMVSELDKMGTDIFIVPKKEKNGDVNAKVIFLGKDNVPYKKQVFLNKIGSEVSLDKNIKNKRKNVNRVENIMSKILNKSAQKCCFQSREADNGKDIILPYDDDNYVLSDEWVLYDKD